VAKQPLIQIFYNGTITVNDIVVNPIAGNSEHLELHREAKYDKIKSIVELLVGSTRLSGSWWPNSSSQYHLRLFCIASSSRGNAP
jgi:hypothetical protein